MTSGPVVSAPTVEVVPKRRKTGRPLELAKPEVREKILEALRWGNYRHDAARYAGVDDTTFMRWMAIGRKKADGIFRQFFEDVEKAEAEAKIRAVQEIRTAAKEPRHWTAAAWFLERRHPKEFSRRVVVEAEGVTYQEKHLTSDEGRAMAVGIQRVLTAFKVRATEGAA